MKQILTSALFLYILSTGYSQSNLEAFYIYNKSGQRVQPQDMLDGLSKKDVLLFGELHNNPINHWMQLELTKALNEKHNLVLGAEMFERDDQVVLNEYLNGKISESHLLKEAKIWPNYETDYKPLVEFAKEKKLKFIATNVPRRYASMVSKQGQKALLDLDSSTVQWLPELPFVVTADDLGYANMRDMMGDHAHGMDIDNLIEAQALKDYAMAEAISKNRESKEMFIHYNGSFHSQYYSGIYHYLKAQDKKLDIGVVASTESEKMEFDEQWKNLGDYIIVTPSSMTKTH
ncbi:MAG: ChaN family lipoprotein [Salibacteraceae bacterium]